MKAFAAMDPCCSSSSFDRLPHFLLRQIGDSLSIDDRISFMKLSPKIYSAISPSFRLFTHLQICDEERESFAKAGDSGREFLFDGKNLIDVLELCSNVEQLVIALKPNFAVTENESGCPIFDTTMYDRGGYVGRFCELAPASVFSSLRTLSLNVDLMVSSFSQLALPCPLQDLYFAVSQLSNAKFNTFIQIGFCASDYSEADFHVNRMLLEAMQFTCFQMRANGCRAIVDIGDNDGYVDMTVESGKVEYSFAFFYYNPDICEPIDADETEHKDDSKFAEPIEMTKRVTDEMR